MILTCPNCETRFKLPPEHLLPDGKRVRCSACQHTWFAKPQDAVDGDDASRSQDDLVSESNKDEDLPAENDPPSPVKSKLDEEIPDSVKPFEAELAEQQRALQNIDNEEIEKGNGRRVLGAIAASVLVFALLGGVLIAMQSTITKSIPHTAYIYQTLGMASDPIGKGLVFDRLNAVLERDDSGQTILKIDGFILNLTSSRVQIPSMLADIRDVNGDSLSQFMIEPPQKDLEAEQSLSFQATHSIDNEKDVSSITIQFRLSAPDAPGDAVEIDISS